MRTLRAFAIGFVVVLCATVASARPPGELGLLLMLNGEPTREIQADGGGLILSASTGIATATVAAGATYVICAPLSATCGTVGNACASVCVNSLDAGCNATVSDPNYGMPILAGSCLYTVISDNTSFGSGTLRAINVDGGAVNLPVWRMR